MSIHNIPFSNKKEKFTLNFAHLQPKDYFLGTQERVRNSYGKRAISVRATKVLLYFKTDFLYVLVEQIISHLLTNDTDKSTCIKYH